MFAKIAIPRPLDTTFDYAYDAELVGHLKSGDLVLVPFGKTRAVGCVIEANISAPPAQSKFEIKNIIEKIDEEMSIPDDVFKLCRFGAEYYQYPLGEALFSAYPVQASQKLKTKKSKWKVPENSEWSNRALNEEQELALKYIQDKTVEKADSIFLLQGITGSGKTEVYIDYAKKVLEQGKSVLILVPEIALTAHLKDRFERSMLCEIALWHSAIADGLRQSQWIRVKKGEIKVIIGARSAIFAPIQNLGLIIVDEEHDATYKQEDRFRYQARDLAVYRAKLSKCPVILGSATPSLESIQRAKEGRYHLIFLKNRFSKQNLPEIKLISLAEEPLVEQENVKTVFAQKTIQILQEVIDRGEQAIIYLNRRGFSQFILCRDCGWIKKCDSCSISMTHYQKRLELRCHVCGTKSKIPNHCESCQSHELVGMGTGTESLEDELNILLKNARVLRLDRDMITSQKRLEETLDQFRSLEANVLIGTQMLVKGHDFPRVTCVVVISADMLLKFPDFRASERALQTLIQVSGRSGRAELPGQVLIQGYDMEHPILKIVRGEKEVDEFIDEEMLLRKELFYPPFSRFVRFRFESNDVQILKNKSEAIIAKVRESLDDSMKDRVLGPSEAILFKVKNQYRYDAYFKAKTIDELIRTSINVKKMALAQGLHTTIDVDPYSA